MREHLGQPGFDDKEETQKLSSIRKQKTERRKDKNTIANTECFWMKILLE